MPSAGTLALIGGGARSGKSRFALGRAHQLGTRRVFIATAQALDEEMTSRIQRHREERGTAFRTLEVPLELPQALDTLVDTDVVVVDCLTLWLSNLLLLERAEEAIFNEVRALIQTIKRRRYHTLLVTNEVGMGLVPESALGRQFRDIAGRAHQLLADEMDEIYLATLGTVLCIRPSIAEVQSRG